MRTLKEIEQERDNLFTIIKNRNKEFRLNISDYTEEQKQFYIHMQHEMISRLKVLQWVLGEEETYI